MATNDSMEIRVSVLGVREDDMYCAIALEMSLRGYGDSFDEASENLLEAIEAQISFAVQHDTLDQIFIPAEPHYHKLYADIKRETMKKGILNKGLGLPDYMVRDLVLPQATEGAYVAA